jgi:phenylacetate-CoA ligase
VKKLAGRLKESRFFDGAIRRPPFLYKKALRLAHRLAEASLEERQAHVQRRLDVILAAAARTRYGRPYAGKPIGEWPYLEKELVREGPHHFLVGSPLTASPAATTGTTGVPLRLWRSIFNVVNEQVRLDMLLIQRGVDPYRARGAVLRGDDIKDLNDWNPPFWKLVQGGRRLVFSSNHLSRETIHEFHRALVEFAPTYIAAYPTILAELCARLREAGLTFRCPVVITSSEVLSEETWRVAERVLGAQVVDYYGLAERVAFAFAFEPGRYHFVPTYAFVELLPVAEDENELLCEIVGTNLWNDKMPLIRYRTGDLARVPKGAAQEDLKAIAFGTEPFYGIVGRCGDYLVTPSGARVMGIDHIPRDVDYVLRSQVIQEDVFTVRILVMPTPGFSEEQVRQLHANASRKLPPEMRVSVEVVDRLERSRSGKTPFVIRRFEQKASAAGGATALEGMTTPE